MPRSTLACLATAAMPGTPIVYHRSQSWLAVLGLRRNLARLKLSLLYQAPTACLNVQYAGLPRLG